MNYLAYRVQYVKNGRLVLNNLVLIWVRILFKYSINVDIAAMSGSENTTQAAHTLRVICKI
jgi:hypothetical protein